MPSPRSISSPPGGYKGGMVERARGLAEVERMAREQARHSADRRRAVPAPVREPKLMTVKTFLAVVGIPLCAAWIAFAIAVGRIAAESLRTDLPAP